MAHQPLSFLRLLLLACLKAKHSRPAPSGSLALPSPHPLSLFSRLLNDTAQDPEKALRPPLSPSNCSRVTSCLRSRGWLSWGVCVWDLGWGFEFGGVRRLESEAAAGGKDMPRFRSDPL